jgi:PAS domain S-box-containing protein
VALDGVISIDQQARITYANTAAEQIFGYRADELIGRPLAETIVPPSLRQAHRDGFAKYLATGEARILDQRIEITAMRADGSEFPAELTITQTGLPEAGRLPVPVQLELPGHRLPDPVEASVYFFCSEALTNVVKHARASSASVVVAAHDARCTVEVRDDGIGGARPRSDSSGLIGLHDRIGALNGAMDIISPAEGGTVLRAWIPLSPAGRRQHDPDPGAGSGQ